MAKKKAVITGPTAKYRVLQPVEHNGDGCDRGDTIEIEQGYADPLLAIGVIEPLLVPADESEAK